MRGTLNSRGLTDALQKLKAWKLRIGGPSCALEAVPLVLMQYDLSMSYRRVYFWCIGAPFVSTATSGTSWCDVGGVGSKTPLASTRSCQSSPDISYSVRSLIYQIGICRPQGR